jgi:hypothetical protein
MKERLAQATFTATDRFPVKRSLVICIASIDIHSPFEQRLHGVNVLFRDSMQRTSSIWIRFVLGNEFRSLKLAILRCQLSYT